MVRRRVGGQVRRGEGGGETVGGLARIRNQREGGFDRRAAPHTVKLMFLYSTVSTLKPIVGMVVTISPSLSLYRMVVLPAASRPTIRMRTSFLPNSLPKTLEKERPMAPEESARVDAL